MALAQTYIVRIYRTVPEGKVAGTVERVRNGRRHSFQNVEELCAILAASSAGPDKPGEGSAGESQPA